MVSVILVLLTAYRCRHQDLWNLMPMEMYPFTKLFYSLPTWQTIGSGKLSVYTNEMIHYEHIWFLVSTWRIAIDIPDYWLTRERHRTAGNLSSLNFCSQRFIGDLLPTVIDCVQGGLSVIYYQQLFIVCISCKRRSLVGVIYFHCKS